MAIHLDRKDAGRWLLVAVGVMIFLVCTCYHRLNASNEVPEISPGVPDGYLFKIEHIDNILIIPPPPKEGSARFNQDQKISMENLSLMGTSRWDLAAQDADLTLPHAANTFSCALGISITEEKTPCLYMLLRRVAMDAAKGTYPAKLLYMRPRPFMVNQQATCTPQQENLLREDGSYPSGHAAMGWACALVLSEIFPKKSNALMARAWAYGQSRVVCNVHWQSDVIRARTVAAATVASLKLTPEFLEDLNAAKKELKRLDPIGLAPTRDCIWEADVLADKES